MHALEVLEFPLVRERLAQHCETQPGEDLAQGLNPWFDPDQVRFEVDRTREAVEFSVQATINLAGLRDHRQALGRAAKGAMLDGATLYGVGRSLSAMRGARAKLHRYQGEYKKLWSLAEQFFESPALEAKLVNGLDGDGSVRDEASPKLASLRAQKAKAAQRITDRIQGYVSGKTRELLSDPIYTQRQGRYVVPLKAENRGKIKGIVHDSSASGQTIYVEPEDVLALGNALREAEGKEREEVERILRQFSEEVGEHSDEISAGVDAAAALDVVMAKVRMGQAEGGVVPQLTQETYLRIRKGRHPMLSPDEAVPLEFELGGRTDVVLITGPNTGGKTVAIKTVGLFVAMAQCGLMPPCAEFRLGPFRQIWADIGDEQSIQQSLSTFSGHIKNISAALKGLKKGALVLLDEVGAGTDPAEGSSLARALLLAFQEGGAKVLASTHFGELKIMATNTPGFENAAMEFDLKSLRPTYRLMMGVPGSSHALRIASRFGIPERVLTQAEEGIGHEGRDVAQMIERLEKAQKQAQRAQSEGDRLAAKLRKVEDELERRTEKAEEARRSAGQRAADALDDALREIRLEAARVFDELKKQGVSQKSIEKARSELKALQEVGSETAQELRPEERRKKKAAPEKLGKGDHVTVKGFTQPGTVLDEPKGKQVQVQVGPMKMRVELSKVQKVEPPVSARIPKGKSFQLQKAQTATGEIQLIAMRAEQAQEKLEQFIDDAVLAGYDSVRIVHGKGEGILRKVTHDYLKRHPHVTSFREADAEEGGQGATVAVLH
jgi:DNA mismatch repair protein MutS2